MFPVIPLTLLALFLSALTAATPAHKHPDHAYHTSVGTQPTTTDASAPATTSQSGSSGVITGGIATYYNQKGARGACGQLHSDSDYIVAIDCAYYGDDSVASLCGSTITIQNLENGKRVNAVIADECPSCQNAESLDLSVAAFEALADLSEGVFPISWWFD